MPTFCLELEWAVVQAKTSRGITLTKDKRIMKNNVIRKMLAPIVGAVLVLMALPQDAHAGRRGLFVGDQYWQPDAEMQRRCRDSRFNTIFLFTLQVNADGSLRFNDHPVVAANGTWVGGNWGTLIAGCRGNYVTNIELAIGNWGSVSFDNIRNLVAAGSPALRRNFTTLKNNINVNAIQMDDEKTYHRHSMVALCKMLTEVGFAKVSLCPYTNQSFWAGVKSDLGSRVSGVWLQCYDGGAGNSATQWRSALGNTSVMYPGEIIFSGGTTVTSRMTTWRTQGFGGGFIWGDNRLPSSEWGQWLINAGF
jgi:hypothetical protein